MENGIKTPPRVIARTWYASGRLEEVELTDYFRACHLADPWNGNAWVGMDRSGTALTVRWTTDWPSAGATLHAYEISESES